MQKEAKGTIDEVATKLEDAATAYPFEVLGIHALKPKMQPSNQARRA